MKARSVRLVATIALVLPVVTSSAQQDEQVLAERYAPVVRLVAKANACGSGKSYVPIDVDVLFNEPTVALRGPWGQDLVKIGPAANDLTAARYEYHLDFPGDALQPGCSYQEWQDRVTHGRPPAVYAHVATDPSHPGKLALQYWLYYVFNHWNNTHEGDWEMIQLDFDASSTRDALSRPPTSIGYSQHEGAERAEWGDDKHQVVDGTHLVVHPAAGSHANFYGEALYLGTSGSEGVGCDDTRGPTFDLRPTVRTIPSEPVAAEAAFPWIAFAGRWGELQWAFFNGPTGPNLKEQWTKPIQWSARWRDRSIAVPGGGALGTGATDFFCAAVAAGSNGLRRSLDHPLPPLMGLVAIVVLIGFVLSRTTWRPSAPLRLARRRAWGQIFAAAVRIYRERFLLFVGIGVVALPISGIATVLQAFLYHASKFFGVEVQGERGGILVLIVFAVGSALTFLGLGIVMAATARAVVEIDSGRRISPLRAYRLVLDSVWPLLGALLIASLTVSMLVTSLIFVPVAIWLAGRWALIVPVVELEGESAVGALRRSGKLVRHGWLKIGTLAVVGAALAIVAGPLLTALLIFATSAPLAWLNFVSGIVYVLAMPFVALATVYVYFDMRVLDELKPDAESDHLGAEIDYAAT